MYAFDASAVTFTVHRSQTKLIPANSILCNVSEHSVVSGLPADNISQAVLSCGFE